MEQPPDNALIKEYRCKHHEPFHHLSPPFGCMSRTPPGAGLNGKSGPAVW